MNSIPLTEMIWTGMYYECKYCKRLFVNILLHCIRKHGHKTLKRFHQKLSVMDIMNKEAVAFSSLPRFVWNDSTWRMLTKHTKK